MADYVGKTCVNGYKLEVMSSAAGYYLGTRDEEGFPNCRVSENYARTADKAVHLLPDRVCEENKFCNGGKGCQFK